MKILIFFLSLIFCACEFYNSLNYEARLDGTQKILVGKVNRETIEKDSNFTWFANNLENYNPNKESIEIIKSKKHLVKFLIFGGLWCGDTKRELPKFYKIADLANINENEINLYCVDRKKQSLDSLTFQYDIKRVPTIIVLKDEKEVGRFVEKANENIEIDLAEILKPLN